MRQQQYAKSAGALRTGGGRAATGELALRQGKVRTAVGVTIGRIATDEGNVLGLIECHAARGAAPVHEFRLRGVDDAVAGGAHAQAVVDVVVGDAEILFVKSAEFMIEGGASHQARARDRRDFARGGVPLDAHGTFR